MTDAADRTVWESDEEALYRAGRGQDRTLPASGAVSGFTDADAATDAREARYREANGSVVAVVAVADEDLAGLRAEVERLRGPFRCCEHCPEDVVHDVEPNQHDMSCQLCDDVQARRAEAAEAELRALREGIEALADEWQAEASRDRDRIEAETVATALVRLTTRVGVLERASRSARALLAPSPAATTGEARLHGPGCVDCDNGVKEFHRSRTDKPNQLRPAPVPSGEAGTGEAGER